MFDDALEELKFDIEDCQNSIDDYSAGMHLAIVQGDFERAGYYREYLEGELERGDALCLRLEKALNISLHDDGTRADA